MTVTGGSSLPKDDIDRMVRDAEHHAEEDRRKRETAETRNQAEQLVYQTEKFVQDNEAKIPGEVKSEVETAIGEVKEKLKAAESADGGNTAELRTATEKLATVSQKLGQAMYADAQSQAQAPGAGEAGGSGEGGSGTAGDQDDVVDAEIVDDDKQEGGAR